MDWVKTTARRDEKHLNLGISCIMYYMPGNHFAHLGKNTTPTLWYLCGKCTFSLILSDHGIFRFNSLFVKRCDVPLMFCFNTLRPRQNGRHFADDIFKRLFLNENIWIPMKISLKFVPKCSINNIPALVQIMAWRRPGDKQLSELMMINLPTHICVTRPQWVNVQTDMKFHHSSSCLSRVGRRCKKFGVSLHWPYDIYVENVHFHWFCQITAYFGSILCLWNDVMCLWCFVLTHWGRDKMDAISQTTFSSAFSWMKIFEFRWKFH